MIRLIVLYIIILFLIIYFVSLIIKYSGSEKPEYNLEYFRDKDFIKYPPIVVGYLNKKVIKVEHYLATALDFVCKGYISLKKSNNDYIFTITKCIQGSTLEIDALKIFFNSTDLKVGTKQSLIQFKKIMKNEKIFGNYGKIKRDFNKKIREYFDKNHDVKQITKSTNSKNIFLCYSLFFLSCYSFMVQFNGFANTNKYIGAVIFLSAFIFFLLMVAIKFIKSALLGSYSWTASIIVTSFCLNISFFPLLEIYGDFIFIAVAILIIMAVIILFDDMLQRKKLNLANGCEMIKGLKKYIIDYSNIKEYDLYNIFLWDEYYVYAVALNIKKI